MDIAERLRKAPIAAVTGMFGNHQLLTDAADEIERLRKAAARAAQIIDDNLYRQREKVEDASAILKQAINRK